MVSTLSPSLPLSSLSHPSLTYAHFPRSGNIPPRYHLSMLMLNLLAGGTRTTEGCLLRLSHFDKKGSFSQQNERVGGGEKEREGGWESVEKGLLLPDFTQCGTVVSERHLFKSVKKKNWKHLSLPKLCINTIFLSPNIRRMASEDRDSNPRRSSVCSGFWLAMAAKQLCYCLTIPAARPENKSPEKFVFGINRFIFVLCCPKKRYWYIFCPEIFKINF